MMIPFGIYKPYTTGTRTSPNLAGGVTTTVDNTSTTSHAVSLPTGITSGEYLFIAISNSLATTISTPSGWTRLTTNATHNVHMYYKIATGAEGSSVTVTAVGARTVACLSWRISGADTTVAPLINTLVSGTSTAPDSGVSGTLASGPNLFISVAAIQTGNCIFSVFPTGYSIGQTQAVATIPSIGIAMDQITATTDNPSAFTISASNPWEAYTIGIQPP